MTMYPEVDAPAQQRWAWCLPILEMWRAAPRTYLDDARGELAHRAEVERGKVFRVPEASGSTASSSDIEPPTSRNDEHGSRLPAASLLHTVSVEVAYAPVSAPWTSARSSLRTGMALDGKSCVKRMTTMSSTGLTQKNVPAAPPQP
jgi:hypothetical protein